MKKRRITFKAKLVCTVLAVLLVIPMFSVSVSAGINPTEGGVIMRQDDPDSSVDISLTVDGSGEGWKWESARRKFTINGCNAWGIIIPLNSTLEIHETNDISVVTGFGSLTIVGDGELTTSELFQDPGWDDPPAGQTGEPESRYVSSCLTIDGDVTIKSVNEYVPGDFFFCVGVGSPNMDEIILKKGTVYAEGAFAGILAEKVRIMGGTLTAKSSKDPVTEGDGLLRKTYTPAAIMAIEQTGIKGDGTDGVPGDDAVIEISPNAHLWFSDDTGPEQKYRIIEYNDSGYGKGKMLADEDGNIVTQMIAKSDDVGNNEGAGSQNGSSGGTQGSTGGTTGGTASGTTGSSGSTSGSSQASSGTESGKQSPKTGETYGAATVGISAMVANVALGCGAVLLFDGRRRKESRR